jgi:polyisoprenyl-teichoic acid--peptidoglycan teichoic acid transferase
VIRFVEGGAGYYYPEMSRGSARPFLRGITRIVLRGLTILVMASLTMLPRPSVTMVGRAPGSASSIPTLTVPAVTGARVPAAATAAAPAPIPPGDARFLVVGLTQDEHRTDTIEVVQWDDAHHAVRILGVPRDIDVSLPGIRTTKLAHAYATGGIGRARAAVVALLNVPIAHYIVFSLPGMRHFVDLIGGVPLDVEKRMVYTDRRQGLFINLYPGPQTLDGQHAEQYLRYRHDAEGDIGRIRRQQHFLRAAFAQAQKPSIMIRMPVLIQAARAGIQTDLTSSQILGWIQRIHPLTPEEVTAEAIDGRPAVLYDSLERMRLDFWLPDGTDLHSKVRWLITGVLPNPALRARMHPVAVPPAEAMPRQVVRAP